MRKLLSIQADAKTRKGTKLGVLTGILYLQPSDMSGRQVCPDASPGCREACLYSAGRGVMSSVQAGRARKTELFFTRRQEFMAGLARDIRALVRKARRENMVPAVRLNGTSDLPWERIKLGDKTLMEMFPRVQFIAWAKGEMPQNYDLTFSRSECNADACIRVLRAGGRVAVVFERINGLSLFTLFGTGDDAILAPVVDGDASDVRFYDPRACIVALKAKGTAKKDTSGFVLRMVEA